MGITVDDTTVAKFSGTPADSVPITSASFTPPSGSLLVLCGGANSSGTSDPGFTASGGTLVWTERTNRNASEATDSGNATIWTAPVVTGASMTVSLTHGSGGAIQTAAKVYIVTAQHASPIGQVAEGTATVDPTNAAITALGAGRLFGACADWNQTGLTSTDVEDVTDFGGEVTVATLYKSADHTAGAQTMNLNFGATPAANWVLLEILADTGGGAPALVLPMTVPRPNTLLRQ